MTDFVTQNPDPLARTSENGASMQRAWQTCDLFLQAQIIMERAQLCAAALEHHIRRDCFIRDVSGTFILLNGKTVTYRGLADHSDPEIENIIINTAVPLAIDLIGQADVINFLFGLEVREVFSVEALKLLAANDSQDYKEALISMRPKKPTRIPSFI